MGVLLSLSNLILFLFGIVSKTDIDGTGKTMEQIRFKHEITSYN